MTRDMKLNPLTGEIPEWIDAAHPVDSTGITMGDDPTDMDLDGMFAAIEDGRLRDENAELHIRVMELETALAQTKPVEDYHGKVPQK